MLPVLPPPIVSRTGRRGRRSSRVWRVFQIRHLSAERDRLIAAERETLKALDLATNAWELSLARKQLQEIRRLMREGTQKPEWTKSLTKPALVLMAMMIALSLMVTWK